MKSYNLVIMGATGAVGVEFRKILQQRNFPIDRVRFLGSSTVGQTVEFGDRKVTVEAVEDGCFDGFDLALFSAGGSISEKVAKKAVEAGCVVVDNSSAWRMDPEVPLVVPEVNPDDVSWHRGIIANPNCSTIQMVVALKPLHDAAKIRRVVVSTYQAVSGSGLKAVEECKTQSRDMLDGTPPRANVYPHPIAFNALPHIDVFLENDYTKEEMKMVNETAKILDPSIRLTATTVRVPVLYGHSESINIETEKPLTAGEAKRILADAPGVTLVDDPANNRYPLAIDAAGKDDVFVGRIRQDESIERGLNLWVVSDNIRKGAALNTVQIAELLHERGMLG